MISLPFAKDRTYFVLGLGKSGHASAQALTESGAKILIWDDKEEARTHAATEGYEIADPMTLDWESIDEMIMGPGVPLTHPAPHPAVFKARDAGVSIRSDMDLLFEAQPEATYVGITGTNGKSTTTALIAHILRHTGKRVEMGGNIGQAALTLEPLGKDGFYVLEMSSYQLDLIQKNPLRTAVLLNITPDHFDRHGGLEGYIEAKLKIARTEGKQDLVLGTDEPETHFVFEKLSRQENLTLHEISTRHEVSQGASTKGQIINIKDEDEPIDISSFKNLPGAHNTQNAAAAFLACRTLGLSREEIISGLESFPGLAHRQQLIATYEDIPFINDSKATNADAASKALVCYNQIHWIIGGQPKVGGLGGLENLMNHVARAYLIGEAAKDFALWCEAKNVPFSVCETLENAVEQAGYNALENKRKNPSVLLSPACASWDQFKSFEHRGEVFEEAVHTFIKKEQKG